MHEKSDTGSCGHLVSDMSVYPEGTFQFDDKLPVIFGHFILEMLLQQVDGLSGNLAHKGILQEHHMALVLQQAAVNVAVTSLASLWSLQQLDDNTSQMSCASSVYH